MVRRWVALLSIIAYLTACGVLHHPIQPSVAYGNQHFTPHIHAPAVLAIYHYITPCLAMAVGAFLPKGRSARMMRKHHGAAVGGPCDVWSSTNSRWGGHSTPSRPPDSVYDGTSHLYPPPAETCMHGACWKWYNKRARSWLGACSFVVIMY